jgi:hypothetical protein
MKVYKVTPSKAPVTRITVEGVPWHFFHSKLLGRCRAIVIAEDENLPVPLALTPKAIDLIEASRKEATPAAPLSKGQKLAILMDCDDRLNFRFAEAWVKFKKARDNESKAYWLAKSTVIQRAMMRLSKKISKLFEE